MMPDRALTRLLTTMRQALWFTIGTWALASVLYLVPYAALMLQGGATVAVIAGTLNICVAGAIVSLGVQGAAHMVRRRAAVVRVAAMVAAVIAAAALLAAYDVWSGRFVEAAFPAQGSALSVPAQALINFVGVVWPFALLSAVYSLMETNALAREREQELAIAREATARAEASASAAQLAALRYQLNPHFLFNTLNAISSLIVTRDYAEADAMLAKLSEFLRATLSADPEGLIPVEDELATLQHYLEIESIRFGDRLEVEFACAPDLHNALLPSFVLQPLVENAIKYGVAPSSRPVLVRIEVTRDGDDVLVMVEDNGTADASAVRGGTGVGLTNIHRRLHVLYGPRGKLEAVRRERGFIAIVRLPLIRRLAPTTRVA